MAAPSQYSQLLPTLLILAAAIHLILAANPDEQKKPITLPGCPDKCGDISIPYPFGTKPGCFLPGFDVTCNRSFNPPRAFLNATANQHYVGERYYSEASPNPTGALTGDSRSVWPFELVDVSPAKSELRVYGAIRSDCSDASSRNHTVRLQGTTMNINSDGPFFLSPLRNALVGVGLNVQPKMVRSPSIDTTTGYMLACLSYIADDRLAQSGSCTGQGCCQATFRARPEASIFSYNYFSVAFQKQDNTYGTGPKPPCTYGMVVDSSWYDFSTEDMYNYEALPKKYPRGVPFVLDFAVGGGSCAAPQGTGCSGNSSCADAPSGAKGYVCSCLTFYEGNPYIPNGCQDINECSDHSLNGCHHTTTCVNRQGGYDCKCKPGMTRRGTEGPCTEKFPLPAKIIVGLSALVVVSVLVFMVNQILKLKRFYEQNGGPLLEGVKNIRIYTRKHLKQITNNYKNSIGEGAFGKVYMGTLKNKQPVAIKKSIKVDEERKKEFTDEVIIQSEMRHKNIVRLLGCCLELDVPMLVYEFVARGSLYDFLFKRRESIPVDTRLKIAIGSAEGLTYMHSAGESTIRHGDVKSANILLDEEFNPKVSDFGTSSLLARGKAEMTERVIGDMSYIDPIYMEQGIVTQKSDVYSFGIVLIELVTRRAATYDEKRSYIENFVGACQDNRARFFFDNDVTCEDDIIILEMVSGVAVECLRPNPEERLDMKQVEHHLRGIVGLSAQNGQERGNFRGGLSPAPDDVALLN
ncbi:hypothetical protein SEVIR_8G193700v4 [Setaria viridis]|uniref:Protein kinase domain-containing protein n=1 Tax=Setaria viridis TaxID=4556 RepID=A0A4U6TKS8_SETVI|nr:wall-associated receptor kinase 2-like [Setaria viridis]TKW01635.1 hypothetical protein SEVIR_8G193700v2 [Setaria viridis]